MSAQTGSGAIGNAGLRELARRSGDGIDVALLWDSGDDRVFVVVDDERRGERFSIAVGNDRALDVFHHPYVYRTGRPRERARFVGWVPGYDRA